MKITVLAENTSKRESIGCEHGLSLFIETEEASILFDMGQTNLFSENAEKLGVDLSSADFAILSHGHYDHGGGLAQFLRINQKAKVYLSRDAFMPHYNGTEKYIGLDTSLSQNGRLIFTHSEVSICKGIRLYPAAENITAKFSSAGLTVLESGEFLPEDFRHEQYLEITERGRKILFSGCSHRGITNIMASFRPDILVGGFHFSKITDEDTLSEYADFLSRFDTDFYTCHCTGEEQFRFLSEKMPRLHYLGAGDSIEI